MKNITRAIIASLCLVFALTQAQAAPKTKPAQAAKENLVLMPLRLGEADLPLQGAMETALLEGLQQKYQVFTGDKVDQRRREVFAKENKKGKTDCDETKCLQDIAAAFNSELLAVVSVAKQSDGYFLAINIRNLWDDKVVYSKSVPCKGCDAYAVVDKLKELVDTPAPVATAPVAEPPPPKITATDPDSITWAEAQKGNAVDDYQVYLDAYPKGKYIAFAKAKLKKLKEAEQAAAEQQEQQAWDAAQQENSEASYSLYLKGYPNGRFSGFAKTRSDKLKADLTYKEETGLWQKAETGNDKAAVENYLNKYPAGRYIAAATAKLQAIKEEEAKWPQPGQIIKDCADCPEMVVVPAGNFTMGSNKRGNIVMDVKMSGDESPAHSVTIRQSFAMGKTEITQGQWKALMGGDNPSYFSNCGDNCPVEQVTWGDAQAFVQRLNDKTGKKYRLPSEAEWEYACRAGRQQEYCGGDDIDSVAWTLSNGDEATHPSAQKQANAWGLYDMSGNVWEWCEDGYHDNYSGAPVDGTAWQSDGPRHQLRGGSWAYYSEGARATARGSNDEYADFTNGFRLARMLP